MILPAHHLPVLNHDFRDETINTIAFLILLLYLRNHLNLYQVMQWPKAESDYRAENLS